MTDDHPPKSGTVKEGTWKYRGKSKVKHLLYSNNRGFAACGQGRPWYVIIEDWKSDKAGLKERRKCKRCVIVQRTENL